MAAEERRVMPCPGDAGLVGAGDQAIELFGLVRDGGVTVGTRGTRALAGGLLAGLLVGLALALGHVVILRGCGLRRRLLTSGFRGDRGRGGDRGGLLFLVHCPVAGLACPDVTLQSRDALQGSRGVLELAVDRLVAGQTD